MRDLYILGTSGLAREISMVIEHINAVSPTWRLAGFIGETGCELGENLGRAVILGDDKWLLAQPDLAADMVVGVGHPQTRSKLGSTYLEHGKRFEFPNIIHPNVVIDLRTLQIGRGNVIFPGCVITCDINIGMFNFVNYNVTVGHDVQMSDYCVINPGASISGYVRIGNRTLVGTGARILEGLTIGSDSVIGAGAVVTKNVPDRTTVVGVPAKPR